MAVNDTLMLTVRGKVFLQDHYHTLHFRAVDALLTEQALIDQWRSNCLASFRGMFNTFQDAVITVSAKQVCGSIPLRAPIEFTEPTATQKGTRADTSEALPAWIACVVSERTAFAGRSRRGRFYIGGLGEGDISGDAVNASITGPVQAYANALKAAFIDANAATNFNLVVHSHKLASVPGTQCQNSSTLVTAFIVRPFVATMKSRRAGSGT